MENEFENKEIVLKVESNDGLLTVDKQSTITISAPVIKVNQESDKYHHQP